MGFLALNSNKKTFGKAPRKILDFRDITAARGQRKPKKQLIANSILCNPPECFGRGHDKALSFRCEFSRLDAIFLSRPCENFPFAKVFLQSLRSFHKSFFGSLNQLIHRLPLSASCYEKFCFLLHRHPDRFLSISTNSLIFHTELIFAFAKMILCYRFGRLSWEKICAARLLYAARCHPSVAMFHDRRC